MTEIMSEELIERIGYKGHQENIRQRRFISIIQKIPAPEGGICPKEALKPRPPETIIVEALMVFDDHDGRKFVATRDNDGRRIKIVTKHLERIYPQDQPSPEVGTTEHGDRYGMPVTEKYCVDNPDRISDMQWRNAKETCELVTEHLKEIQKLVDGRLVDGKIIHDSGQVHMSKEQFMRFLQTRSQLQLSKLYGQFDPIDELYQLYNQLHQAKKEQHNRKEKRKQESQQHREQQRQRQPEKKKIATNKSRKKERRNAKVRGRESHEASRKKGRENFMHTQQQRRENFMHTQQQSQHADTAQHDRKDEEQQEQPKKKKNNKKGKRGKGNVASAHQRQQAKRVQKRELKEEVAQLKAENAKLNIMCVRSDLDDRSDLKLCHKSALDWAKFKKQKLKSELEEKNYENDELWKQNEGLKNDLWRANKLVEENWRR